MNLKGIQGRKDLQTTTNSIVLKRAESELVNPVKNKNRISGDLQQNRLLQNMSAQLLRGKAPSEMKTQSNSMAY